MHIPRNLRNQILGFHYWLFGDPEVKLIRQLCDRNKVSIDVGANIGDYTYYLKKYSKLCYAFEPNPEFFKILNFKFDDANIIILDYAISSSSGIQNLRIPIIDHKEWSGMATLDQKNTLGDNPSKSIQVKTLRLDDLNIDHVGLIKIDVEGHEFEVLKGAVVILNRDHPNLIIEIEERHYPESITIITSFLENFGYKGFFLLNNYPTPIQDFNPELYQNVKNLNTEGTNRQKNKIYINNFVFTADT
jgi:FkbM family methyltransferase